MLTKWHVGALVLLPFGRTVVLHGFRRTDLKHFGIAALAAAIPVGGWIGHITRWFPTEATFEWSFKSTPFSLPVNGHRGTIWSHLDVIADLVPPLTWWLVLPAVLWMVWRVKLLPHRLLLISCIGAIHLFFMLARTKMLCYTLILLPFCYPAMGNLVVDGTARIRHTLVSNLALLVATAGLCDFSLDPVRIVARHSLHGSDLWTRVGASRTWPQWPAFPNWRLSFRGAANRSSSTCRSTTIPVHDHLWHRGLAQGPGTGGCTSPSGKGHTVFVLQDGADPSRYPAGVTIVPDSVFAITKEMRL
ncbi:MAG: hypothetical protein KBF80_01030 [Flavobacteriales bacterium]|nr:hypothetical protein [Flavobacteriales bacterium]